MRVLIRWMVFVSVVAFAVPASADIPSGWTSSGRTPAWIDDFDGGGSDLEHADDVAVSPSGQRIFVTGGSVWAGGGLDWVTMAFARDGTRLWTARLEPSPGLEGEFARSIVTGPGGRVFVTGEAITPEQDERGVTVAYDARTGDRLWVRTYPRPDPEAVADYAYAAGIALSPSGRRVFVAGTRYVAMPDDPSMETRYAVWAYRAWDGEPLWATVVDRGAGGQTVNAMTIDPEGRFVLTAGESGSGFGVLALRTGDGSVGWFRRYDVKGFQNGVAIAASTRQVFVSGYDRMATATVAYGLENGRERWVAPFGVDAESGGAQPQGIAVSPDGTTVAITGFRDDRPTGDQELATAAYAAWTGVERWTVRDRGSSGFAGGGDVVIPATGDRVIVTGYSRIEGIVTAAYAIGDGTELWRGTAKDGEAGRDGGAAVAADPAGMRVYLVAITTGGKDGQDFATLAYDA